MGRTATTTMQPVADVEMLPAAVTGIESAQDALAVQALEASKNAKAIAVQVGYQGALTVGTLEDEIRFYQRRTVEAILETGKRLLIL